ncbi:MAG TPA: glycosyltransferase family 4 protein [Candidatus Bathyarchaeia archaeon]|nr:glycosyltransferase family 4 protein [Candidatus Bathyarchaeia archaeon]
MTEAKPARIDGDELFRRLRDIYQTDFWEPRYRSRYIHEVFTALLDYVVKDSRPYSRLPPKVLAIANRFFTQRLVPTFARAKSSFSTQTQLRDRNLKGRILAVLPYSIFDPVHGGQFRAHDIYTSLSKYFEIIALSLQSGPIASQITPNLENICYSASQQQINEQRVLAEQIGALSYPIAIIRNFWNSKEFVRQFEKLYPIADVVIFSHPYLFQLSNRMRRNQIVIYDSTDVEYDLFKTLLRGSSNGRPAQILRLITSVEAEACKKSDRIFVTSKPHAKRLTSIYGTPTTKITIVPNPIDKIQNGVNSIERENRKSQLGLHDRPLILYLASWHPPHVQSLQFLLNKLAPQHPEWSFLILGTVANEICKPYMKDRLPQNIIAYTHPTINEKAEIYKAVDVAIDPATYGSGTEIKILVYMAAGLPIVSTRVGVRGLKVRHREHVIIAERAAFGKAIAILLNNEVLREKIRANALEFVSKYRSTEIATRLAEVLSNEMRLR